MNAEENTKIVKDGFAAYERGDIEALVNMMTDDVEWQVPGEGLILQAGYYRGRDAVRQFFAALDQNTEFGRFEGREFVAQGDHVITLGWYQGRVKPTGRSFESYWAMSFTMRDGKIAKFREYTDTAAITAAYVSGAAAAV